MQCEMPLKQFYKGNEVLSFIGLLLFIQFLFYFIFYNSQKSSLIIDAINFAILIGFIFSLFRVSNSVQRYLPALILLFTLINNFSLLYSILTNPEYVLGQRATVQYNKGTGEDFSGNPVVFGRSAVAGLIISLLFLIKKNDTYVGNKSQLLNLLSHINLLTSLLVLILTQTRGNFISFGVILLLYIVFAKHRFPTEFKLYRSTKVFYLGLLAVLQYFNSKYKILDLLSLYSNLAYDFLMRALNTVLGLNQTAGGNDASASGRLENIAYIKKIINRDWFDFIFGKGYKFWYTDIPTLEAYVDFGILGAMLFVLLNVVLVYYALIGIRSKHLFQNFLGLFYFNLFVAAFTGGRPMDFSYWVFYLILLRFLLVIPSAKTSNE